MLLSGQKDGKHPYRPNVSADLETENRSLPGPAADGTRITATLHERAYVGILGVSE